MNAAPGVRLEVLDWGGRGTAMLLLAGSGDTAHVYDEFAPKLTDLCHVYGVTRRGFGASDRMTSGYDDQRLADDVVAVVDRVGMEEPIIVGHSAAGNEMTTVASQHPNLASALVYRDAAADPKDLPIQDARMRELFARTPDWYRGEIEPTSAESQTFDGFAAFQRRQLGFAFSESELRQVFATNSDGSGGRYRGSADAGRQMAEGTIRRDYKQIHVPILAFFAGEPPARTPADADERAAIDVYRKEKRHSPSGGNASFNKPEAVSRSSICLTRAISCSSEMKPKSSVNPGVPTEVGVTDSAVGAFRGPHALICLLTHGKRRSVYVCARNLFIEVAKQIGAPGLVLHSQRPAVRRDEQLERVLARAKLNQRIDPQ